jgi:hypothetical protein
VVNDRSSLENQQVGLEKLHVARVQVLRSMARLQRFGEKIDEAFAGQPFLSNIAPDAPANRRRFKTYLKQHRQVTRLLCQGVELWMMTFGMKREDDWIPLAIEELRRRTPQDHLEQISRVIRGGPIDDSPMIHRPGG